LASFNKSYYDLFLSGFLLFWVAGLMLWLRHFHVNKVKLPSWHLCRPLRPTQPSYPLWVGPMSTGDGFSHRWGRNASPA